MRRLFFCFEPDWELKEKIDEMTIFLADPNYWRKTKIENLHATMLFLGEIEENKIEEIIEMGDRAIKNFSAPEMIFEKTEIFPKRSPKILAFFKDQKNARMIHEFLKNTAKSKGIKIDEKDFNLHITLARPKMPIPTELTLKTGKKFEIPKWKPESLNLTESFLNKGGPEYRILKKFYFKNQ